MLKLYKIFEDDISPVTVISPKDVVVVSDASDQKNKKIFLWKGPYSPNYDEFKSVALYNRLLDLFFNPEIYIITDTKLIIDKNDSDQVKRVKDFLQQNLPDLANYRKKRMLGNFLLLTGIREKIKEFKRYESSNKWNAKVSNLTNIWRLSIFNVIAMLSVVVLLLLKLQWDLKGDNHLFYDNNHIMDPVLWEIWLGSLITTLFVAAVIILIVTFANLMFVLIPMKFPINPKETKSYSSKMLGDLKRKKEKKIEQGTGIKLPPSSKSKTTIKAPKMPPAKGKVSKSQIKISIPAPKLPGKKTSSKAQLEMEEIEKIYSSDEDAALGIPKIPMRKKIELNTNDLEIQLSMGNQSSDPNIKVILVECDICGKPVKMPVPKKLIEESKLPVTDVTFIHGKDKHAVTAQIDKDFAVRRRRSAPIVFEDKK